LHSPITKEGTVLGTLPYMAPEQHRSEVGDARSDQYSFCVALFEALVGTRPFVARSVRELEQIKQRGAPTDFGTSVPSHVQAAITRGLAPQRDARFPTMTALLRELERDPAALRRKLAIVVGALGLAAVTVWGVSSTMSTPSQVCAAGEEIAKATWSSERRATTEEAFLRAGIPSAPAAWQRTDAAVSSWLETWTTEHREACEATRVRGEQSEELMDRRIACLERHRDEVAALLDTLQSADATAIRSATDATAQFPDLASCRDTESLALRQRLPPEPEVRAAIEDAYRTVARAASERAAGHYQPALASAREAVARARELPYAPLRAEAELTLATVLRLAGDPVPAELAGYEAVWAATAGNDQAIEAAAWIELFWIVGYDRADFAAAERIRRHAEATIARLRHADRLHARFAMARSLVAMSRGDLPRAQAEAEDALSRYEQLLGEAPAVASAMANLATVQLESGQTHAAIDRLRAALAMYERVHGPSHPDVVSAMNNLGNALTDAGRTEEALEVLERVIAAVDTEFGAGGPRAAAARTNFGNALAAVGRGEEALVVQRNALDIASRAYPADHPSLGVFELNLAGTLLQLGKPREALAGFERALAILERSVDPDHRHLAHTLVGMGFAQLELREAAAAQGTFERAEGILLRITDEAELARARFGLACALHALDGPHQDVLARLDAVAAAASALPNGAVLTDEIAAWRRQAGL
jgi:tetratricopeptide (TPR) repeat protein